MLEWETRKPIRIAGVGKLDPCLLYVAASRTQRIGHGLDDPQRLPANGVVDEKNPGHCYHPFTARPGGPIPCMTSALLDAERPFTDHGERPITACHLFPARALATASFS